MRVGPSPVRGGEAGGQQPELERGKVGPRGGITYQTASRLPVANQVFLGSWMVNIHQEGHSQRSSLQRRHTAHLREHSCCASWKPSGWDQGGDNMHHNLLGRVHSPNTWSSELLGPGKGTKRRPNKVCAFVEYLRT